MSSTAHALRQTPESADVDLFPLRERLRFRSSLGHALLDLRSRSSPFQQLAKGPWALFIAIAVHWQGNAEAWPSQDALSRFSGFSERAVRDYAASLERGGFLRLRRERRASGAERIYYAPGFVLLRELGDFIERYPRERAKALPRLVGAPTSAEPPEAAAATPPAPAAAELLDQDQKPSSCGSAPTTEHVATPRAASAPSHGEEQQECFALDDEKRVARATSYESDRGHVEGAPLITEDDRSIARIALAERMQRKYPDRATPRWFDRAEVEVVAMCAASVSGDRETKIAAQRDALASAFRVSKSGPPSVRFIWGKVEHFFDHVERGRRARTVVARVVPGAAPPPTAAAPIALSPEERARRAADIQRLFDAGKRPSFERAPPTRRTIDDRDRSADDNARPPSRAPAVG